MCGTEKTRQAIMNADSPSILIVIQMALVQRLRNKNAS